MNAAVTQAERDALQDAGIAYEYAQADTLADMDAFSDWLRGHCIGSTSVSSEHEARIDIRLINAPPQVQMHAGLVAAMRGDAQTCLLVLRELTDAYLLSECDRTARRAAHLRRVGGAA